MDGHPSSSGSWTESRLQADSPSRRRNEFSRRTGSKTRRRIGGGVGASGRRQPRPPIRQVPAGKICINHRFAVARSRLGHLFTTVTQLGATICNTGVMVPVKAGTCVTTPLAVLPPRTSAGAFRVTPAARSWNVPRRLSGGPTTSGAVRRRVAVVVVAPLCGESSYARSPYLG